MSVLQAMTFAWAENLNSDELKFFVLTESDLESTLEEALEAGNIIETLFDTTLEEFEGDYLGFSLALRLFFLNSANINLDFVTFLNDEKIFDLTVENLDFATLESLAEATLDFELVYLNIGKIIQGIGGTSLRRFIHFLIIEQ